MYIRAFSVFFLFIVSSCLVSCKGSKHSKIKRLPGVWQATPIVVDGSNKDWPSPYTEYDDKAMLGYMVSNDKENLYITVETGDPATQLKILREGLTVWIDRKAEKSEETAINFPIPSGYHKDGSERPKGSRFSDNRAQGRRQDQQRMELEDKVMGAMPGASQYSLQGFKNCNLQYAISEKDSCGIEVSIGLDSMNEMIWEAKVPLRSFYFKPELTRADKGKPLTICVETTGMERPAGQQNNNGGGGMRPSMGFGGMGMGMRTGGMRGDNRGQQQNNIMEPMYKSTKTYKKFGLAFQ